MSLVCLTVKMQLLSDGIFSSGNSIPGDVDIALRVDGTGTPILPGSTFKGLLRESLVNYLCWTGQDAAVVSDLFGQADWCGGGRRLIFCDLRPTEEREDWVTTRTFTQLEEQVVKTGTLRTASCLRQGLIFQGELLCDDTDVTLIQNACRGIKWAGLLRHRGFGRVKVTATKERELPHMSKVEEAPLIYYRLKLLTPMVISQYSRSWGDWQSRNDTDTKKFLPGSAVRGMILSTLARENGDWFQAHKAQLLGPGVRFLNALPVGGDGPTIPTPMGFYEHKADGRVYTVLTEEVCPGDKRADLGTFCTLEGGNQLCKVTTKTGVSLRMKRRKSQEDQQVFNSEAIAEGTELEGLIQLDDQSLAPELSGAFYSRAWLGADKFAGNGLCRVMEVTAQHTPANRQYSFQPGDEIPRELYMMLLSPTAMTRCGDAVGLDEETLADLLKLPAAEQGKRLEIVRCATAIREQTGFNRTWGCAAPSEICYEAGSVFRLRFAQSPALAEIRSLEEQGIGLRRSEGYGQVLFLKDYPSYRKADDEKGTDNSSQAKVLIRQARCRWLLEHQIPKELSNSQLGAIQVLFQKAIAGGGDRRELDAFFEHNQTQRGARHGKRFEAFRNRYEEIMSTPLYETLGIDSCDDGPVQRMRLLYDWILLERRGAEK
jgi:hypothetical protein